MKLEISIILVLVLLLAIGFFVKAVIEYEPDPTPTGFFVKEGVDPAPNDEKPEQNVLPEKTNDSFIQDEIVKGKSSGQSSESKTSTKSSELAESLDYSSSSSSSGGSGSASEPQPNPEIQTKTKVERTITSVGNSIYEVNLLVSIANGDYALAIDEDYPQNAIVIDNGKGNSMTQGHLKWVFLETSEIQNITYILQNPSGKFSGIFASTTCGQTSIGGQESI